MTYTSARRKTRARDAAVIDRGFLQRNNRPWHTIHTTPVVAVVTGYCRVYAGVFLFVLLHPSVNYVFLFSVYWLCMVLVRVFLICSWHSYSVTVHKYVYYIVFLTPCFWSGSFALFCSRTRHVGSSLAWPWFICDHVRTLLFFFSCVCITGNTQ